MFEIRNRQSAIRNQKFPAVVPTAARRRTTQSDAQSRGIFHSKHYKTGDDPSREALGLPQWI